MKPKICVPIVEILRDQITACARKYQSLPIEMVEWRVDFFAGYEKELPGVVDELKSLLGEKELIVTLRTEAEGGEPNGSRFDYFSLIEDILKQGKADYVDVEVARDEEMLRRLSSQYKSGHTKIIGSYHDFEKTPSRAAILKRLQRAKTAGADVAKLACMPQNREDVDCLLEATAAMKEQYPDYPLITMSMGELGVDSRLYGGLYGSEVSFGCAHRISAPGQVSYERMREIFDKIYKGNRHIILIGFMGVGKSTISRELKVQSNRMEIDTDEWIERQEGCSISEIFEKKGESYFRRLETEMIDELGTMKPAIISCGGGMALRELNVRKLRNMGSIVLLTAEPETILERVQAGENRPLLNGNMNTAYIRDLMEKRRPFYERAAMVKISTDHRMISDIAKEILEKCF